MDCLPSEPPRKPSNLKARLVQEREVSSAVQMWPTAKTLWVMWSIHKVSVKWVWWDSREEVVSGWKAPIWHIPHRFPMQQHWTGSEKEQSLPTRASSSRRRRRTVQVTNWHHMPRRATPGGPLGTLTKLDKNSAACVLLKYVSDNIKQQNPYLQDNTYYHI